MNLLQRFRRLNHDPLLAWSMCVWLLLPPVVAILQFIDPRGWYLCPLKSSFGIPCFSCGMTRMTISLAQGEFLTAFYFQPLGAALLIAILVYGPISLLRSSNPWNQLLPHIRWILTSILILGLFNWFYLIAAGI